MCGVVGVYGPRVGQRDDIVAKIAAGSRSLTHRGPDDEGVLRRDHAVLAHRRLSIIDLTACGHQPMCNETGDVWVIYNGEVYNHSDLRAELIARGHQFRSNSDTESLIHGYEEWGIDGLLERLRGMFAFALYDVRANGARAAALGSLYLVRDRFGIKPLYYALDDDGHVVFGSEVRALMESGTIDDAADPKATLSFLLFGSVTAPLTIYKSIKTLPPGHYLSLTPEPKLVAYYSSERLFDGRRPRSMAGLDAVRSLLEETVRIHLLSDAPLGVFLSGGIDSTALVALAARATPGLRTVSIVFDDPRFSEKAYQVVVQKRFQTDHHELHVSFEDMEATLASFFAAMDQPTVDGLNTFFVSRAARQAGLKVVLSGLGGDEVFGGYETLRRAAMTRRVQWLPTRVIGSIARLAPRRVARKLDALKDGGALGAYISQRGLFSPREVAMHLGAEEREVWSFVRDLTMPSDTLDARSQQQLLEFQLYLPDQLLRDSDVFGMAHSLEIRVPFLDHVLAEAILALPNEQQRDDVWPKPPLTKSLQDLLPPEIVFRRKQGFTFPFGPWLSTAGAVLGDSVGTTSLAAKSTWQAFAKGEEHWSRPWALYVLDRFSRPS